MCVSESHFVAMVTSFIVVFCEICVKAEKMVACQVYSTTQHKQVAALK